MEFFGALHEVGDLFWGEAGLGEGGADGGFFSLVVGADDHVGGVHDCTFYIVRGAVGEGLLEGEGVWWGEGAEECHDGAVGAGVWFSGEDGGEEVSAGGVLEWGVEGF